ncbi:MAG: nitroreductase family protein [Gammaproteobacteria bacterium]|nr:nitroreductase family protein [Gammaproteobacteria bacterium]
MVDEVSLSFERKPVEEMRKHSEELLYTLKNRRTVRDFSDETVPMDVIENAIKTAATAPNGANLQPWHFVVITNQDVKAKIREAAEAEEREFYNGRAPQDWLDTLAPLGTDESKPFLETAPVLIGIFSERYRTNPDGERSKVYYPTESVGIACGMLIAALHTAGLATLTHTPSPMGFMNEIMERPKSERPFLLLVVGYPERDAKVPNIEKKEFSEICTRID